MGIEALRAFLAGKPARQDERARPDPVVVAACALLLEIAHADDVFRPEERERIARHIRDEMGVADSDLRDVLRLAEEERRESVDLFQFTRLLANHLSREQRLKLVEAIWGVVYSDGTLSEVESHLARRIAELLGFQHPEVQAAKETVLVRETAAAAPEDRSAPFSGLPLPKKK
ncbi:MAG: TerB family tellurite resistance protein [Acidobacteria bacterium]|nr:TerB family tellurite resistance protein [Acidobacteriota bacterium]